MTFIESVILFGEGIYKMKTFTLIIVDDNNKIFNVITDLADDTYYTDLIAKIQETKKGIRCFTTDELLEGAIEQYELQMDYKYVHENILDQ